MTNVTDNFPSEYFPPTPSRGVSSPEEVHAFLNCRRRQLSVTIKNLLAMAEQAIEREDIAGARILLDHAAPYIALRDQLSRKTA